MVKSSLQEFLQNRNLLAMKISSRDLAGFFTKRLTVPMSTVGLALYADGALTLIPEGREVAGSFDLLLAKVADITLRFQMPDLRSKDGASVGAEIGLSVAICTSRADLYRDFARTLFNFPGLYATGDFKAWLMPELRKAVADFVEAEEAATLHKRDRLSDAGPRLASMLERHLFGSGVMLKRVLEVSFDAPDYGSRVAAEARKSDDKKREVERLGQKEERVKRLASFLQEQPVQDLIGRIKDDRLKGLLYAKLMEDDALQLSAQDLIDKAGQVGGDMVKQLYRAMEGLLGTGEAVNGDDLSPESAEQLLIATGSKVLAIDPAEGRVTREYAFRDPLRSVRSVDVPGGPMLLVGARRTLHALAPWTTSEISEFPLPGDKAPKGGVNAVAAHGGSYYATHSEYGVTRWDAKKPGAQGELLFEDLTTRHKTTRCAQVSSGFLLFATGPKVYAVALGNGMHPISYDPGADGSSITCLAAGAGFIFAGTENGSIVSWRLGEPDRPSLFIRKRDPIVNLRIAKVSAIPHLFYSAKDYALRARVIGQSLETSYEAGGATVGVLDAASDLIVAGDGAGRRVMAWKPASPARPLLDLDASKFSDKPVLDLWLKKVKAS